MGKRSNFQRKPRDFYPTPPEALPPLLPHLKGVGSFCEPCAGDGQLVDLLCDAGLICTQASDIKPGREDIEKQDALDCAPKATVITNMPWDRPILHKMIEHLAAQQDTWVLLDADWKYTVQKAVARKHGVKTVPELMRNCRKVVAVGRVSWEQNGKKGKDNCAWYLFGPYPAKTEFVERS